MRTIKNLQPILLSGIIVLLTGCASVKFYEDANLKNESGLRVYSPKPYLLVEYQATKTESVKTSIVYLPDLSAPQYVKVNPGIGSAAVKLELNNGILTSYGLTTDTKIPETLGKVTDLLTRSASAITDLSKNKTEGEVNQTAFELFEVVMAGGQTKLVPVK